MATVAIVVALALVPAMARPASAASASVTIEGFYFLPPSVTVLAGETVTWTNNDPTEHTATSDSRAFDTGVLAAGASRTITFSSPGTFPYGCEIHGAMRGTVTVQARATLAPTSEPTRSVGLGSASPPTPPPPTVRPATPAPTPVPTAAPAVAASPELDRSDRTETSEYSTPPPAATPPEPSPSPVVAGSSPSPVAIATPDDDLASGPPVGLVAGVAVAIGALALVAVARARRR